MEERRLLLAVALSLLVLTAYQFLFPPAPPRRPNAVASAVGASASPSAAASGIPIAPATSAPARARKRGGSPPPSARLTDDREKRVELQGQEVAVAFSNRGARLVSWQLLRYRDAPGRAEEMVQTVPGG